MLGEGTCSNAVGVPKGSILDDLRKAYEKLRSLPPPRQGYLRAGSPRLAAEAVLALVRRLRDIGAGVSRELPEDVVLVLWRPSGPCAYLHPDTLELLQACIAFDAWMGREERRHAS